MATEKIKVVFGMNDFLAGGLQQQFLRQLPFFDREHFDITLITLLDFPGRPAFYESLPKDISVNRLSFSGIADVRSWWRLYMLLRKIQPNLVVSSIFFSNFAFRFLKPLFHYSVISREHNTYIHKPTWQQYVDRILAPFSYRIVAVSKAVMEFTAAQEKMPLHAFKVICNGIDVEGHQKLLAALPPREKIRAEFGFNESDVVFLNTSRLVPQKNYSLLIEGFAKACEEFPSCRLAIVGGGSLQPVLEEQVKALGVENSVVFFGHQSDTLPFYKAADFYISTSEMEGFSNSMLEAMTSGVPVVTTKTGGTDELIVDGHTGFLISTSSSEGVSLSMKRAMQHISPLRLREEALQKARAFDIRRTVEEYSALFEESVAAK